MKKRSLHRCLVRKVRELRNLYFDKFFFIHINKTGGSSIQTALKIPYEHKTVREKTSEVGTHRWQQAITFSVVRNPWDRAVSQYLYRVRTNKTGLGRRNIDFNEWVILTFREKGARYFNNAKIFLPQVDWLIDEHGKIAVDRICRFERLELDSREVCEQLGLQIQLPHLKASKRAPYRTYYNDTSVEIIADRFGKDVRQFGYIF